LWRSNSQRKPQPRPTATQEFEQYLRKASKICGAFPDEDAATKGDVPGTPQPGKKMKRRPGEINTLNQLALSWEANFLRQRETPDKRPKPDRLQKNVVRCQIQVEALRAIAS
jgi:hypothetical protein